MSIIDINPITDINGETYEDYVDKLVGEDGVYKLTGKDKEYYLNNPYIRDSWKKNATRVKQQYLASKLQGDNRVNNISAGVLNAFAEVPAFFGSLVPNDLPGEALDDVFTFQNIYDKLKTEYKFDKEYASEQLGRELSDKDSEAVQNFIEEKALIGPGLGLGLGYVA